MTNPRAAALLAAQHFDDALVFLKLAQGHFIHAQSSFPEFVGEAYVEDALLEDTVKDYRRGLLQARMALDKLIAYAKAEGDRRKAAP